jgi:hypothetical protein
MAGVAIGAAAVRAPSIASQYNMLPDMPAMLSWPGALLLPHHLVQLHDHALHHRGHPSRTAGGPSAAAIIGPGSAGAAIIDNVRATTGQPSTADASGAAAVPVGANTIDRFPWSLSEAHMIKAR